MLVSFQYLFQCTNDIVLTNRRPRAGAGRFFLFFLAISSSVLAFNVILVVDIIEGEVYQNTYMGNVKERLWGSISQKQNRF